MTHRKLFAISVSRSSRPVFHPKPLPPYTPPVLTRKDSRAPNMSICGLPLMFSDRSNFNGIKLMASNLFSLLYEMSSVVRFDKPLKASLVILAKIFLERSVCVRKFRFGLLSELSGKEYFFLMKLTQNSQSYLINEKIINYHR